MGLFRPILVLLAAVMLAVPAAAAPLPRYGAFVFSNVCNEAESGDDAGARLILVRLPHEDSVLYTWSEGALMAGTVDKFQIDNRTGHVSFHVAPDAAPADWGFTITGQLSAERFIQEGGRADSPAGLSPERMLLSRVRDFARDNHPPCKPVKNP